MILRGWFLAAAAWGVFVVGPASADTRTYVIGWFGQATDSQDDDCPAGVNPDIYKQYVRDLVPLGYSQAQAEEIGRKAASAGNDATTELRGLMVMRGRIDGKPVNPYGNPAAVADPHLNAMAGKYAYGFNLDGKGAATPHGFEDPETHEAGVNDELARALGCMRSFRGSLATRPTYWAWAWGQLKDSEPAWLMTVTAADFTKDSDVTITFDRALEHLRSNVDGSPKADATYRVDSDPRSHNVFKGRIKNGVLSFAQSPDFHMMQNPLMAPELRLTHVRMRFKSTSDGGLTGFIGGYQPWSDLYFGFAGGGPAMEVCITGDIPGLYYLLKKYADADPDPKTGQNTTISATYYLEAVPAFLVSSRR